MVRSWPVQPPERSVYIAGTGQQYDQPTAQPVRADPVAKIARLDPPAESGNDAFRRVGGHRASVRAAYKLWRDTGGPNVRGTGGLGRGPDEPVQHAVRNRTASSIGGQVDDANAPLAAGSSSDVATKLVHDAAAEREAARIAAWWSSDGDDRWDRW